MNVLKPHVSLNVSNVDASVAFYEKAFNVRATKHPPLETPSANEKASDAAACCAPGLCTPRKSAHAGT